MTNEPRMTKSRDKGSGLHRWRCSCGGAAVVGGGNGLFPPEKEGVWLM